MFDQATDGTGAQTGHRDGGYWGGGYPDQCRFHVPMATDECFVIDWPTRDGPLAAFNADGWGMDHGGEPLPKGWMGQSARQARDGSGLMYRRNRYYDPASGRFTQEDPIGLAGGINLYGYADGDPVSYSDPFGLSATCNPPTPECLVMGHLRAAWGELGVRADAARRFILREGIPELGIAFVSGGTSIGISITRRGAAHVLARHFPGGALTAGKSIFHAAENLQDFVKGGENLAGTLQGNGNFRRVINAGREVGFDVRTGQFTNVYTIITNKADELITMFPGM